VTALQYRFSKRIFAAALRLAALYAGCVTVAFVLVLALARTPESLIDILPFLGIPGATCFAAAFILLAFARRAGFIALWLTLLGLWLFPLFSPAEEYYLWSGVGLVFWSMFAAPLFAMVAVGFPTSGASSRSRRSALWILGVAWLALVILNLRIDAPPPFVSFGIWRGSAPLSLIIPPVISAIAIRRIWRAKAPEAR
jgi:hypothetical protein